MIDEIIRKQTEGRSLLLNLIRTIYLLYYFYHLQTRISRIPKGKKCFQRSETHRQIITACSVVADIFFCRVQRFHLQKANPLFLAVFFDSSQQLTSHSLPMIILQDSQNIKLCSSSEMLFQGNETNRSNSIKHSP